MLATSRITRTLLAACLVAVMAAPLLVAPSPASGLEPPRPLPGYHPRFVTQIDGGPVIDCLWASGAMLLDKWTNGRRHVSHERLRRLSGDLRGGSLFPDLRRAYRRLGIDLKFSPDGGARITWPQLLRKLRHGAGAIVLGDYSKLPYWYGRWDYRFWKGKGKNDNHAMYIERYDRKHDRVWLMDPLARGKWNGEWIPVWALRRFVWSSGGALFAAVTPTAKPAPFKGVKLGAPSALLTAESIDVAWPIRAPRKWKYPGADVTAEFVRAKDPPRAAVEAPPPLVAAAVESARPAKPRATVSGGAFRATAALPSKPGAYLATLTVTDRRFGREVASSETVSVFVPGPRRATLRIRSWADQVETGTRMPVSVAVANTGELTWADPATPTGTMPETAASRGTHLVATWIPIGVPPAGDEDRIGVPDPVTLGDVPLAPGRRATISADIRAPSSEGRWALVIDVVDGVDGSFAARGTAPAVMVLSVVAPRGLEAPE